MKKILFVITLGLAFMGMTSCLSESTEDKYKDWRNANNEWLKKQTTLLDEDGKLFYTSVVAPWDPNATVLIHWFNDRNETKDLLSPIYSSTVDVKYIGRIYTGEAFDSSYVYTSPADSVARINIYECIEGWGIALPQMHCGDSCRVVVDYPRLTAPTQRAITSSPTVCWSLTLSW